MTADLEAPAPVVPSPPRRREGALARLVRPLRGRQVLLACQDDGLRLTVAVIAAVGDELEVERCATRPRGVNLDEDLRAALAALAERGPLPREAVLVSSATTALCLDLPPTGELALHEARGLVQRELEPFVSASGDGASIACGWSTRPADRGPLPLLVAGMDAAARDRLAAALGTERVRLRAVYPLLACAGALMDPDDRRSQDVLEVGADRISCARVAGGVVTRLVVSRLDGEDGVRACVRLCEASGPDLVVAGPAPEGLEEALERGVVGRRVSRAGARDVPASLLGAARHALRLRGAGAVASIPGRDPPPPLLTRPLVRAAAAALVVVSVAAAGDQALVRHVQAERRLADPLREQLDERLADLADNAALQRRAGALRAEVADLERRSGVHQACERRRACVRGLLDGLAAAASPGVAVDAVEEAQGGVVALTGFALSDLAAQRYVHALRGAVEQVGFAPRDLSVRRATGRLGLSGFAFDVRLVRSQGGDGQ